jgi:hypothetical protein
MALQAAMEGHGHAADHQGAPCDQGMNIIADSNAHFSI